MRPNERRLFGARMTTGVVIDFLQLFVAMYISELLVNTPAFGGALFIAGEFWTIYFRLFGGTVRPGLPKSIRNKGILVFVLSVLPSVALIFIYPRTASVKGSLLAVAAVTLICMREIATNALATIASAKRRRWGLVGLHAGCIAVWSLLFWFDGATRWNASLLAGLALTGVLLVVNHWSHQPDGLRTLRPEKMPEEDLADVSSYNIFNRMVSNVLVAVNLSILSYIFYLKYLSYDGFMNSLLGLVVWALYVLGITELFARLLNRKRRWRFEKPTLFVVGVLIWVTTILLVFRGDLSLEGVEGLFVWAIFGFSLSCLLSIVVSTGAEMRDVIELALGGPAEGHYLFNTVVMVSWSTLISNMLVLIVFTLASFIMNGQLTDALLGIPVLPGALQLIFFLLPLLFVIVSLVYLIRQPLDAQYREKLEIYRAQKAQGEPNEQLERRLKGVLVAKYPRWIAVRLAKILLRPFFPLKIEGREHVKKSETPVVFVCNHYEMYGPLAAVLRLPFYFRPWIINDVVDRALIAEKLNFELRRMWTWCPKRVVDWLSRVAAPVAAWVIKAQEPIAVHRNSRGIVQTMNETVEALESADNILIFPENPLKDGKKEGFKTDGVCEFFSGFSAVGRLYYKASGRRVSFVPVFVNKERRVLSIGEAVVYDEANSKMEEKARIVETLHERMTALAEWQTDR